MAEEAELPPEPNRASALGRWLFGYVGVAGTAGAVGASIGGAFGGLPGAAVGMGIGVWGGIIAYGWRKARQDHVKWAEYRQFLPADVLKAEQRKRRTKMILGTAIGIGVMAFTGIGIPSPTAYMALAVSTAALGGSYLMNRLRLSRRDPTRAGEPAETLAYPGGPPLFGDRKDRPDQVPRPGLGPWGGHHGVLSPNHPWTGGRFGIAQPAPAHGRG